MSAKIRFIYFLKLSTPSHLLLSLHSMLLLFLVDYRRDSNLPGIGIAGVATVPQIDSEKYLRYFLHKSLKG